jgi:hypothetical protein
VKTIARQCAYCNQPLPAWKASNGRFYCNEFCAWDGETAARRQIATPPVAPTLVQPVSQEQASR